MTAIEKVIEKIKGGTIEEIANQIGWSLEGTRCIVNVGVKKGVIRRDGDEFFRL